MSDGGLEVSGFSSGSSTVSGGAQTVMAANTQTVSLAGSNLIFENTYGSGVSQDYINAVVVAENYFQVALSTTATLRFNFEMGDIGDAVGQNSYSTDTVSFAALSNALSSHEDTATAAAIAEARATFAGASFAVPEDLAFLLGLPGATSDSTVTVTLNQKYSYRYDPSSIYFGGFDAIGALMHEISEGGFGRTGGYKSGNRVVDGAMDLFRYSASGQIDTSLGQDGRSTYFSSDGATLSTQFHNPVDGSGRDDGYDSGDWGGVVAVSGGNADAFGAAQEGQIGVVTPTDLQLLKVLGWSLRSDIPPITVSSGQTFTASAGPAEVLSHATVPNGGVVQVLSGGLAVGTMIRGGDLYAIGATSSTRVWSGVEYVLSGGQAISSTIDTAGVQVLSSGATTTGTILNGGTVLVLNGAVASSQYQFSGALYVAGDVVSTVVGGQEFVLLGGRAAGWVIPGGVQVVSSGGEASRSVVSGTALVYGGGSVASGWVEDGGVLYNAGDAWSETVNFGDDFVLAGGRDHGAWVAGNGVQVISSGGVASGGTLSGGLQLVFGGGSASGVTLYSGGRTYVSGAVVSMIELDGGDEFVLAGGASTRSFVHSGAVQVISSGATASGASVQFGGMQLVFGGGVASGTTINGGSAYVSGAVSGTTLSSAVEVTLGEGASVSWTSRFYPGVEFIQAGGASFSTTVSSGGVEVISSGAAASGLNIAGGQALVFAGATARATTISGGQVYASGTTVSTMVLAGVEFVLSGGTASAATVSGGFEVVSSGGATTSAVISSGGQLLVYAGGDIGASLTLAGGVAYMGGAMASSSTITFAGSGGKLVLDDPAHFHGQIASFNLPSQSVDLSGFAYTSGETASWTEAADHTSGILTVTDGAMTATLDLLGSYVTSNFTLSGDGSGGTFISDPPVPGAIVMAQAMASIAPGGAENVGQRGHDDARPPAAGMIFSTSAAYR